MDGGISGLSTVAPELFTKLVKVGRGALEEAAEPHRCVLPLITFYTIPEGQRETVFVTAGFSPIQRED